MLLWSAARLKPLTEPWLSVRLLLATEAGSTGTFRATVKVPLKGMSMVAPEAGVVPVTRLRVTGTTPASGATIDIPFSGTFTVALNVPVDPASVANSNLSLSQGSVSGFSLAADHKSISYTLTGLTQSGAFTVAIADGAYRDVFGTPGVGFSGTYTLHYNHFPY